MKWKTLVHNGVMFPPPYKRLAAAIMYKGRPLTGLTDFQEEALVLFARHMGKPQYTNDKVFVSNFLEDLGGIITDINGLDFRKARATRVKTTEAAEAYRTCLVDGVRQPVSNFRVEPPDLFKGRGEHPLRGRIKRRILPKDVTLNMSKGAPVPKPNVGGEWGAIIHNPEALWIASWTEAITGKRKYVFLAQNSKLRQAKDIQKYDTARLLGKRIDHVRKTYMKLLSSGDNLEKQMGAAIYLIDRLALRVGNEKGEDTADTVGVTSLKVGNIRVDDGCIFSLDFLGKDSIRYQNSVYMEKAVCAVLTQCIRRGSDDDDYVFDLVRTSTVNEYLHGLMPGLTAKVFRTYNASHTFSKALHGSKELAKAAGKTRVAMAVRLYNRATVEVATLCNHQKAPTKSQHEQITRLKQQLKKAPTPEKRTEIKERITDKQLTKNFNLGTSRNNYIDPRITVSFFKSNDLPLDKAFSKTLRDRFTWAIESTPAGWEY